MNWNENQLWDWAEDPLLAYHKYVSRRIPVPDPNENAVMRGLLLERLRGVPASDLYLSIEAPDRRAKAWKDMSAEAGARGLVALLQSHAQGLEQALQTLVTSEIWRKVSSGNRLFLQSNPTVEGLELDLGIPNEAALCDDERIGVIIRVDRELSPGTIHNYQRLLKYRYLSSLAKIAYELDEVYVVLVPWLDSVPRLAVYKAPSPVVPLHLDNIAVVSENTQLAAGRPVAIEVAL